MIEIDHYFTSKFSCPGCCPWSLATAREQKRIRPRQACGPESGRTFSSRTLPRRWRARGPSPLALSPPHLRADPAEQSWPARMDSTAQLMAKYGPSPGSTPPTRRHEGSALAGTLGRTSAGPARKASPARAWP